MTNRKHVEWIGLAALQAAVARNPAKVRSEAGKFLVRGKAIYMRTIINSPWAAGSNAGGGAPHDTGNLRDTHIQTVNMQKLTAVVKPDINKAPYAPYVHGLKGYSRKRSYILRPWLDHAKSVNKHKIKSLEKELITNITKDLAR